jgi:hypothetical protein
MFWRKPKFEINALPPGEKTKTTSVAPAAEGRPFGAVRAAEISQVAQERVAFVVIHGMGQQVEYETLGQLGDLMVDEEQKLGTYSAPAGVKVVRAKISSNPNDAPLSRAEFTVKRPRGLIDVHVYEGYWAPLTEGKISFLETVTFLFTAAWNGIKSSVRGSAFKRWMFDGFQDLPIKEKTLPLLIAMTIALIVAFLPLCLAYLFWDKIANKSHGWVILTGHPYWSGVLLVLLAIYCWLIYYVMVEYVGDVVIYVSSYKVSRFEEVRHQIQDAVFKVVRQLYSARANGGDEGDFLYDKIVVVGHSLGTVIAYDMLNAAISWDMAEQHNTINVVGRTSALITFGSPLDKTAFLFRTQVSGPQFLREALAAQRQPLILDYEKYRPKESFHWTNIYSHMDIVSGCLLYYDTPEKTEPDAAAEKPDPVAAPELFRNPVNNVIDRAAWIPLLAHVQYWGDQALRDELYGAIK